MKELDTLIARWTRAGAGFSAKPASRSPDLERLLLDTARHAHSDPRLLDMAFTWLCSYGDLIAKHRLCMMIADDLEVDARPVMGLLLDLFREQTGADRFNAAIRTCKPAIKARPLFDVYRRNPSAQSLLRRRASAASRRWRVLIQPIEPHLDALRPADWVMRANPAYRLRALFKGDARASILEVLRNSPDAGSSEVELARQCGLARAALRYALNDLELIGAVDRGHQGNRHPITRRSFLLSA